MVEAFPTVVVYADATAAPEARPGWPDYLSAALASAGVTLARPVVNLGSRSLTSFADVVRLAGADRHALPTGTTALLSLSHADGRRGGTAPQDAAALALLGVRNLQGRWADLVVVVGPTGAACPPGLALPARYASYLRWHRRTESAIRLALGDLASYVSLADLPADLTRDGVRPTPKGWQWVAERVAAGIAPHFGRVQP